MYAYRPTITPGFLENRVFGENDFLKLTINPKSLWIPRDQIAGAAILGLNA